MRWRWIGLMLLAALLGLWLVVRAPHEPEREHGLSPAVTSAAAPGAAPLLESAAAELARSDAAAVDAPAGNAPAGDTPDPVPATAETPDLALRAPLTFLVVDAAGHPISGAEISLTGTRTTRSPGSHFSWRIEEQLGRTDGAGRLTLEYPKWTTLDAYTGWVTYRVLHPRYVTHQADARVAAGEERVELQLGSVLVVSGWVGEPSQVITDVVPELSWDVDLAAEDWLPRRDGKLTTNRVAPGRHLLRLEHRSAQLGRRWSAPVEFVLESGAELELHLELLSPRRFRGRFADEIPRPIVDGRVSIMVQTKSSDARAGLFTRRDAAVSEEGRFEITELPTGEAQYVAMCRGWTTPLVEAVLERGTPREYSDRIQPQVDLGDPESEQVLALQPASRLEVTLRTPEGEPLALARVDVWPNVCWTVGLCQMYFHGRAWSATTDERGVALIEDLPANRHSFGVSHPQFQLPLDPPSGDRARRSRNIDCRSGETARIELTVERTGG